MTCDPRLYLGRPLAIQHARTRVVGRLAPHRRFGPRPPSDRPIDYGAMTGQEPDRQPRAPSPRRVASIGLFSAFYWCGSRGTHSGTERRRAGQHRVFGLFGDLPPRPSNPHPDRRRSGDGNHRTAPGWRDTHARRRPFSDGLFHRPACYDLAGDPAVKLTHYPNLTRDAQGV